MITRSKYEPWRDTELARETYLKLTRKRTLYLAGPFFNDPQCCELEEVEEVLDKAAIDYFSPRLEVRYKPGDPARVAALAHWANCYHLDNAKLVLALLSTPDTGTAWELGYAHRRGVPIIGVTSNPRVKVNLMVAQIVDVMLDLLELRAFVAEFAIDRDRGRMPSIAAYMTKYVYERGAQELWKGEME